MMRIIDRRCFQRQALIALATIAVAGVPFLEGAGGLPYGDSSDFGVDTYLTDVTHGQPAFDVSAAMPFDTRGINRVWADSGGCPDCS